MTQGNREKQHVWDNTVRKRGAAARALQQREHRQRVVPDKRRDYGWDRLDPRFQYPVIGEDE